MKTTDIVLVGGGHAHVHVLKAFGAQPAPGVRLTLVSIDPATPYSGMLPGLVAGLYTHEQAHIDLKRLAAATGTRLIEGEAVGIDRGAKRLLLKQGEPIAYDILSLNVGITPAVGTMGDAEHGIAVKPIGSFLAKFDALLRRCREPDGPRRIAVIGGGAGGVELLLSVRARLAAENPTAEFLFWLVTEDEILPQHNRRVRSAFRRICRERGVVLQEYRTVRELSSTSMTFVGGQEIAVDAILLTTGAAPPAWFAGTGLARDSGGFLAVGPTLQVRNDPDVFAAGDCASLVETPRPKSGVFAVRAGPPLAENLLLRANGRRLKRWRPQRLSLALISTGERYAVASYGSLKIEGAWVWRLKDWIDRRWMRRYQV